MCNYCCEGPLELLFIIELQQTVFIFLRYLSLFASGGAENGVETV